MTSARESAEVGRHLSEFQVPAMRGGLHASPNYMVTAVVLVRIAVGVRVIATARSIRVPISIRVTGGVVAIVVHHSPLLSFIPVSLFDLESRFFAPTHTC